DLDVRVLLQRGSRPVFERTARLDPDTTLVEDAPLAEACRPQELTLEVLADDRRLISYTPLLDERPPIPAPATAAKPPAEIASNEELYLNGLHLEQYSHATCAPEPYYEEALRRDPGDSRCHNALGLLQYRRGQFNEAERHFRAAVRRLTLRNPNPYDGEAFYNLGLALKMQGRRDEAFAAFYKAAWNEAWQSAAYFELARLACWRWDWEEALDLILRCLERNARHHRAHHLHVAILRKLRRRQEALAAAAAALQLDPFNAGAVHERDLLSGGDEAGAPGPEDKAVGGLRGTADDFIEIAVDYAHAGLFDEARDMLDAAPSGDFMRSYYAGWIETLRGENDEAAHLFRQAAKQPREYAFPHRLECVPALLNALDHNLDDALAAYALGNFLYARRRHEDAIRYWDQARSLDPLFPTVWRNLALAYMNKQRDSQAALAALQRAFELNPSDARVFFELDQLLKRRNVLPAERLERLSRHQALVRERDDLTIEWITLLNLTGRHREALDTLLRRRFHPWEGGEGKVTSQYVVSLVELARAALAEGRHADAIELLNRARTYPPSLGEGKLAGATENDVFYYLGLAHEALGHSSVARTCFEQAATGAHEPHSARYYNDQPPEMIFYQGLARRKLGEEGAAAAVFHRLIDYGIAHLADNVQMDYFAVSLPDFLVFDEDLNHRNRVDCNYLMALGHLGLEQPAQARERLETVLALDANHLGAHLHRGLLESKAGAASADRSGG
ncbi:MAG: tetratricopeptide repeat protein, partial [Planctomycetes bacterium]|nr:tetratricopeptide repeat protein [Planctomycetota bacterium]